MRFLRNVEPEHEFILVDGARLKNLDELGLLLDAIEDEQFVHHVTAERNDFSTWVRDGIGDVELADQLLQTHDAHAMAKIVKQRIRELRAMQMEKSENRMHARIKEFLFGLVIGTVIGLLIARIAWG